jgi:hypothetical protein
VEYRFRELNSSANVSFMPAIGGAIEKSLNKIGYGSE